MTNERGPAGASDAPTGPTAQQDTNRGVSVDTFAAVVLGERAGTLWIAYGRGPFRNERDLYKHREFQDRVRYAWPADRVRLASDVAREVALGEADVYVCPALHSTTATARRKRGALAPVAVWADLDGPPVDPALYEQLVARGAVEVDSGTDGHTHLYLPLSRPIPVVEHEQLGRALAQRLGGDAKWSDESLLRLPGTLNLKPTVPAAGTAAGPAAPVTIRRHTSGRHDPAELAELLDVDLAAPAGRPAAGSLAEVVAEPMPESLPEPVQRALQRTVADRSAAHHALIGACKDAGLTTGQTLTVAQTYRPSVEKYGHRLAAEVARSWGSTEDKATTLRVAVESRRLGAGQTLLPESFWKERSVFGLIRDAAHSRLVSADLVLHVVLAKLAAMSHHRLTFDSGRGTHSSLNYFVAPVGPSGVGKTTGAAVVNGELLPPFPQLAGDFHDGLPLGTGEGLAEAYMGAATDEQARKVRGQVRHNVFVVVDEGETFTRLGERDGATVGTTLRSAWVGATIGQANGRQETTRVIQAGNYSLGMVIGFQPQTALPLLEDTATGTAQRFAWVSAIDPTIPDEPAKHPGLLPLDLTDGEHKHTLREGVMTFPDEIKRDLRNAHLRKIRGEVATAEADTHEPLMRCKMAALLALLDNRAEVDHEDWRLAGALWETSCAVRDAVAAQGETERARQREIVEQARVNLAERTAAVVGQAPARVDRLAVVLAERVVAAGCLTGSAARKGMRSDQRHLFDAVAEQAELRGLIRRAPEGGLLPPLVET